MADLANLDLESLENLLEKTKNEREDDKDRDEGRSKKKKHKERSRSRSRSHKKKHKKRSRSRSHSRKKRDRSREKKRGSKSRSREHREKSRDRNGERSKHSHHEERDKEKEREREKEKKRKDQELLDLAELERKQREKFEKEEEERKKREVKALEEKLEEAKKQLEEARRDDSTVQVIGLSIKTDERKLYEFIKNQDCGKIRDIRIIKDPRTGKSKGIAYIEFYGLDSVNRAIALSGKEVDGCKVKIQPSQAEKNRAAAAAKQLKQAKAALDQAHMPSSGSMRIFVSGLTDQLADIEEKDLKDLFAPFGDIERIELHRDDITGKSKGYAFILFRNAGDAKRAILEMNNFIVNGKQIKVQAIQAGMANMLHDGYSFDLDDESGGAYLQNAQSKILLMQKLQRDNPLPGLDMGRSQKPQTSLLPTNCILLSNMFDIKEVDLTKEPGYFMDLKDEVEEECRKYGDLEKLFIEQDSPDGNVWIKFRDTKGASTTYQTLNNKYFSNRKILCSYVTENTFNIKYASL